MLSSLLRFHEAFHWLYHQKGKKLLFSVSSGLFIWLFLGLTQSFGLSESNASDLSLFFILLPVGLIWIICIQLVEFLSVRVFHLKLSESPKLDFLFWFIKLFVFIHIIFFVRGVLCSWLCLDWIEYLQLWFADTLMLGICYLIYTQYAKAKISQIRLSTRHLPEEEMLSIGQGKDQLIIDPAKICYIQSDDNYLDIFFLDSEEQMRKKTIRSSIKSLMSRVKSHAQFVRIHRSHVINSQFYSNYSKGNGILQLKILGTEHDFPVSRKYKSEVSRLFNHPKI